MTVVNCDMGESLGLYRIGADLGVMIVTRQHHAVDPAVSGERRVRVIRKGMTSSIDGREVAVRAEAICLHSDTPDSVVVAMAAAAAVAPFVDVG